jgi:hypothetical protein
MLSNAGTLVVQRLQGGKVSPCDVVRLGISICN